MLGKLLEGKMNNKWFFLLMTPLLTYASYENDGWDDQESFNHAVVMEEESAFIDDYTEPYLGAVQDDFIEENEVVSAPVVSKRTQQKRISAQSQADFSSKRSKDIRQNSNRPRVTHRDRNAVEAVESEVNSRGQEFVFQENEVKSQQARRQPVRQANQQRVVRQETPASKQEAATEEQQVRRLPARQANQQRVVRQEAPVRKQKAATEEQQVRRQPVRQANQQRAVRQEAPVPKQKAATKGQQVRRQPERQANQQRAVRQETSEYEQEAYAEEQPAFQVNQQRTVLVEDEFYDEDAYEEAKQVRRLPARQANQQRAAHQETSEYEHEAYAKEQSARQVSQQRTAVVEDEFCDEEAYEEAKQVRRQPRQQKVARIGGRTTQRHPVNKTQRASQKSYAQQQKKLCGNRWAVPLREYIDVYADEEPAVQKEKALVKKQNTAFSRGQQQAKRQAAQSRSHQGFQRQDQNGRGSKQQANSRPQQRRPAAQSEQRQMRSEKMSQAKAQAPKSYSSGKCPQSE